MKNIILVMWTFLVSCEVSEPSPSPTGGRVCCRECVSGKPCGDSCISATSTCHKGPGCACLTSEIEEENAQFEAEELETDTD